MKCAICGKKAQYRCARIGKYVCPEHARFEVVARRERGREESLLIRAATARDLPRIEELALYFGDETEVDCFDRTYDMLQLPAYVACADNEKSLLGEAVGLLSYAIEGEELVIVMLNVLPEYQGHGAGRSLLQAAIEEARRHGLSRILVTTSNDDLPALYLYQSCGFAIFEVVPGRIAKHHGEEIAGFGGIGVRDEIRLQRRP